MWLRYGVNQDNNLVAICIPLHYSFTNVISKAGHHNARFSQVLLASTGEMFHIKSCSAYSIAVVSHNTCHRTLPCDST